MHKSTIGAALCLTALTASAAAPRATLPCGAMPGVTSIAEMKAVPSQGINSVDLTFIGSKPSTKEIERLLRECVLVGSRRDGSKDILASAWLRKRASDNERDDDLLHSAHYKTMAVRDLKLQKK